jgi:hypothetical protein
MPNNSGNILLESAMNSQQSSGQTVRFFYENAGKATLPAGIISHGTVFQAGELPSGQSLVAKIGGANVSVQVDVKTTYPDGSAKMAILTLSRPELVPGASLGVELQVAPSQPKAALDLAGALAPHQFSVALTNDAGQTQVVDVLATLKTALVAGDASFWQSGPLASQARVEVPLEGSQRLVFDVTAYQGGGFSVEAQFNNDRAMEAVGGRVNYDVAVTMDGKLVTDVSVSQAQYQNWHRSYSSDGLNGGQGLGDPTEGWLNIRHDVAGLIKAGAVANYNLENGVSEKLLQGWAEGTQSAGWGEPLSTQFVTQYMPGVGGRTDIGFTTAFNTAWLMTQDPRAAAIALGQAEASGAVPWNMWDAKSGTWLNTDAYPNIWSDWRGGAGRPGDPTSTGLTQYTDGDTGWSLDSAHQPDLSYVPYLMTGSRWMLDNLQAQASWNIVSQWPLVRGGEDLLVQNNQVRGAAWSLRQVDHAAWVSPDGSAEKAFFTQASAANWAWLVDQIPAWTALQGEAHGWIMGEYGAKGALPPWQQDYFASTTIAAAARGNADAMTFLEWQSNFLIGRFQQEANGFKQNDGAAYLIAIADHVTNVPFKTWAEVGQKQKEWNWSNGDGWGMSQGDYAQLALATLAGIANLTGSAAATQVYYELVAKSPPFTSPGAFLVDPIYAIAPPNPAGTAPTPPPVTAPPPPVVEVPPVVEPVQPTPPADPLPVGMQALSVVLAAESWNGDPLAEILLNGVQVFYGHISAQKGSEGVEIALGNVAANKAHAVTVRFLNDAWGGTADTDRNLFVEDIRLDGVSTGLRADLLSNGAALFDLVAGASPPASAPLPPAPPPIDVAPPTPPMAPPELDGRSVIRVGLSQDAYEGNAQFQIMLNGKPLGEVLESSGSRSNGDIHYVEYVVDVPVGENDITVRFLNDHFGGRADRDRNLYVESIEVNGESVGEAEALFWNRDASFRFKQAAAPQPAQSEQVAPPPVPNVPSPPAATTLGTGPDTLRLALSADVWNGAPEYVLYVNGALLGGRQSVGAERALGDMSYIDVRGAFNGGANELLVRFLNDAWGGTPDTDRNLYVEAVALNGVDLQLQAALYTSSDAVFLF